MIKNYSEYMEIIDLLNQMTWIRLVESQYPNERRYDVLGTPYSFYINPVSILWVEWTSEAQLKTITLEDVLDLISPKIQHELLFNLEIFKHSSTELENY